MIRLPTQKRGAVLTEAAIALPLLLALVSGVIDLAVAFADRCAFVSAFHSAARKVSIEATACDGSSQLELQVYEALEENFYPLRNHSTPYIEAQIDSTVLGEPSLLVSGRVKSSCIFCIFFFAAQNGSNEYSSRLRMPLERGTTCG